MKNLSASSAHEIISKPKQLNLQYSSIDDMYMYRSAAAMENEGSLEILSRRQEKVDTSLITYTAWMLLVYSVPAFKPHEVFDPRCARQKRKSYDVRSGF